MEYNIGVIVYISNHNDRRGCNERRKIHRIDSGTICVSSGLDGDARYIVSLLRDMSHQECQNNGDLLSGPISSRGAHVAFIARECGKFQHRLTLQPGVRPFGVSMTFLGLLQNRRHLGLFQCEAGGIVESCECTSSGIGHDRVKTDLAEFLGDLRERGRSKKDSNRLEDNDNDNGCGLEKKLNNTLQHEVVSDFVNGVANVALERYLEQNQHLSSKNENVDDEETLPTIDIYLVKPNSKCRGGVQISCATDVRACDLGHVVGLFAVDVCDSDE